MVSFEKPDRYTENNSLIEKLCLKNNIQWYSLIYNKKPPILSTIFDLYKMKKLAKKLHFKNEFSIIYCRSYISWLVGLNFKKIYGIPFLFN